MDEETTLREYIDAKIARATRAELIAAMDIILNTLDHREAHTDQQAVRNVCGVLRAGVADALGVPR